MCIERRCDLLGQTGERLGKQKQEPTEIDTYSDSSVGELQFKSTISLINNMHFRFFYNLIK